MKNKCENCGKCCIRTEMILTQQDIDLIIQNFPRKIKKKDFIFKNKNGFFQLKNSANHCVFFDLLSKKCIIYEYRPQGCRFYPLIYDFIKNKCIFDIDCPRTHLFYQKNNELKKKCIDLKHYLRTQLKIDIKNRSTKSEN
ncbi:MAG: YkgJ family cysteine cluster protein [Promethearchaeota archaeon]